MYIKIIYIYIYIYIYIITLETNMAEENIRIKISMKQETISLKK